MTHKLKILRKSIKINTHDLKPSLKMQTCNYIFQIFGVHAISSSIALKLSMTKYILKSFKAHIFKLKNNMEDHPEYVFSTQMINPHYRTADWLAVKYSAFEDHMHTQLILAMVMGIYINQSVSCPFLITYSIKKCVMCIH